MDDQEQASAAYVDAKMAEILNPDPKYADPEYRRRWLTEMCEIGLLMSRIMHQVII